MPPEVSVLVGAWNNAATLRRAIDSILAQTVSDLELIVVDDGSTDATPEIVSAYDDSRVRRLALEHMGISRSLNRGLEEARAPAVAINDADDWSLPTRLERQLELLAHRPDVAVVGCWMDEVDESGTALQPRQPRLAGEIGDALIRFNPIPGTASMMRRDVALRVGGFDSGFLYAADYELWSRISADHRLYCLPEVLAMREMSVGAAGGRHEREQLAETLRVRARLLRRRPHPTAAIRLLRPLLSWATPGPLKAAVRRRRGMAP